MHEFCNLSLEKQTANNLETIMADLPEAHDGNSAIRALCHEWARRDNRYRVELSGEIVRRGEADD